MTPQPELASTKYCLANSGVEYLVFLPKGVGAVKLKLPAGQYRPTWFDPGSGAELEREPFRTEEAATRWIGRLKAIPCCTCEM